MKKEEKMKKEGRMKTEVLKEAERLGEMLRKKLKLKFTKEQLLKEKKQ